jgi:YD repeat-containing protein
MPNFTLPQSAMLPSGSPVLTIADSSGNTYRQDPASNTSVTPFSLPVGLDAGLLESGQYSTYTVTNNDPNDFAIWTLDATGNAEFVTDHTQLTAFSHLWIQALKPSSQNQEESITLGRQMPDGTSFEITTLNFTIVSGQIGVVQSGGSVIQASEIPASGVYLGSDPLGQQNVLKIQLSALSPSAASGFYTLSMTEGGWPLNYADPGPLLIWRDAGETEAVVPGETVFNSSEATTLYVENAAEVDSGQITLELNWTPNGMPSFQTDVISTLNINLMGDLQAGSDWGGGAFVRVSNAGQDELASQTAVGFVPVYQAGHNDLMPLVINAGSATGGTYQLNFSGSAVTVWSNSNGTDAITSGESVDGGVYYVEGVTAGTTPIELQWLPDSSDDDEDPTAVTVDQINITVVQAQLTVTPLNPDGSAGSPISESAQVSPGFLAGQAQIFELTLNAIEGFEGSGGGFYSLSVPPESGQPLVQIWSNSALTQTVNPATAIFDASQNTTLYVELTTKAWLDFGPESGSETTTFPIQLVWRSSAEEQGDYSAYPNSEFGDSDFPLPYIITDTVRIGVANPTVSIFATDAYAETANPLDPSGASAPGVFTISRGEGNYDGDLAVEYTVNMGSENGLAAVDEAITGSPTTADYYADGNWEGYGSDLIDSTGSFDSETDTYTGYVVIPDGQSSTTITINPIDQGASWDKVVSLSLINPGSGGDYTLGDDNTSATVTIVNQDDVSGLLNRDIDTESTGQQAQTISNGSVDVNVQEGTPTVDLTLTPSGIGPVYNGNTNLQPIISVDMLLPAGPVPTSLTARLIFGGISAAPVTFDATDLSDYESGDTLHFVLEGNDSIADELATGHYDYTVVFTATVDGQTRTRTVVGGTEIVNLSNNVGTDPYGAGWSIGGVDELVPSDGTASSQANPGSTPTPEEEGLPTDNGFALIRGDNTSAWYEATPQFDSYDQDGLSPIPTYQIVDPSSPDFSTTGNWQVDTDGGIYDGGPFLYADSSDSLTSADWQLTDLAPQEMVQVFVSWTPDADRTDDAQYSVDATPVGSPSSGSSTTIDVDQQYTPGILSFDGQQWRSLGFYAVGSDGSLDVTMQGGSSASGNMVAGAVMAVDAWTFATPSGTFSTLQQGPLQTALGSYSNAPGDFTLAATDGTFYQFNDQGQLNLTVDRNGNQTQFNYNSAGALSTVVSQGGFTTTFNYTGGYLNSIVDPTGRTTTYHIVDGELTQITEPFSAGSDGDPTTTFVYDGPDGLLSQVTNADSQATTLDYDWSNDRIDEVINPDTHSWSITPFFVDGLADGSSDAEILLAADGNIGNDAYDGSITEVQATYENPNGDTYQYQTDSYGLETAEANPDGVVWQWQNDANGLTLEYIQPAGGGGSTPISATETTSYTYDDGNLASQTNPDGSAEDWGYGPDDQISVYYLFNPPGSSPRVLSEVDYGLDAFGNTLSTQDGSSISSFTYTALPTPGSINLLPGGLLLTSTDPDGNETENVYYTSGASNGLVHTTTVAYGTSLAMTTTFNYDSNGNPASTITPVGTTTYVYDNLNLLVSETDPPPTSGASPPTTTYTYDPLGNQLSVTDPSLNKTSQTYNAMGEVATATSADNQTTTYTYDADGNLQTTKDPKGNVTTDYYNSLDELWKVTEPAIAYGTPTTTYSYDTWGDLASMDVIDGTSNHITYYDYNNMVSVPRSAS